MVIVSLVEENIFTIVALSSILLDDAVRCDTMLLAQCLPELISNYAHHVRYKNSYFGFRTGLYGG